MLGPDDASQPRHSNTNWQLDFTVHSDILESISPRNYGVHDLLRSVTGRFQLIVTIKDPIRD